MVSFMYLMQSSSPCRSNYKHAAMADVTQNQFAYILNYLIQTFMDHLEEQTLI